MDLCARLGIVSLTVNALFVAWLFSCSGLRIFIKWRRSRLKFVKGQSHILEDFVDSHRTHLAAIFVDSLLTLGLFACGLYLVTSGSAVSRSTRAQMPVDNDVTIAMVMYSVGLGRLMFTFLMAARRIRVFTSPTAASVASMQCIDHLVSIISLALIIAHQEDMLTGAVLLIMSIDCNVYGLGIMMEKMHSDHTAKFREMLNVLQCFLSIAFRFAVPFVCTIISFVVYDRNVLKMNTASLSIFISCCVFYLVYNTHIIASAIIALWRTCAKESRKDKPITGHVNDAFFLSRNNQHRAEIGSYSSAKKTPGIVCSMADLDNYLDQNVPPPYENYRRLPTPRYFRPSLNVPVSTLTCKDCAGVITAPSTAPSRINTKAHNTCAKTQNTGSKPQSTGAKMQSAPKPSSAKSKTVKSKTKGVSKSMAPFSAELPTIQEELSNGFSFVDLNA